MNPLFKDIMKQIIPTVEVKLLSNTYDIYKASTDLTEKYECMMRLYDTDNIDVAMVVFTGNDTTKIGRIQRDGEDAVWFNMQGFGFYIEQVEKEEKVLAINITNDGDITVAGKLNTDEPKIGEYTDFGRVVKHIKDGQIIRSFKSGTCLIKRDNGKFSKIINREARHYVDLDAEYFEEQWAIIGAPCEFHEAIKKVNDDGIEVYFICDGNMMNADSDLENYTLLDLAEAKWFYQFTDQLSCLL